MPSEHCVATPPPPPPVLLPPLPPFPPPVQLLQVTVLLDDVDFVAVPEGLLVALAEIE
ncbi:MAG: hypothetical protein HZC29_03875 [Thaumarchaeota archaeon]|nr:hypothetical protein [Nitrososphaerota archaeon]